LGAVIFVVGKVPSSVCSDPIFVVLAVFPDCVFVFLSGAVNGAIIKAIIEVFIVAIARLAPNIPEFWVPIILSLDLYFITIFRCRLSPVDTKRVSSIYLSI